MKELAPTEPEPLVLEVQVLAMQGHTEAARQAAERALSLDAESREAAQVLRSLW